MRKYYARSTAIALVLCATAVPAAAQQAVPPIRLISFMDFNYLVTDREVQQGFREGQLAGHVVSGLTERLTFFGELSATATPSAFNLEVERAILRYDFLDQFKLSVGRYHTPVSYWNTAFHHGQWLQTTVSRPEMIKFGGRVLPVHFVGAMAEGTFPSSPLGLGYAVGIGNGRHSNVARAGDAGDINAHRAWTASLYARPTAIFGLQVGGSIYGDRASTPAAVEVDERILSGHLVWDGESPEVIAEYARVLHDPRTGGAETWASDAFYGQLAYRLPGSAHAFKPYARFERVDVPAENVLLGGRNTSYNAAIAGLRYDFAPVAALKAEYRRERFETLEYFQSLFLQVSFTLASSADEDHTRMLETVRRGSGSPITGGGAGRVARARW
jgi:hypothetical protein